MQPPTIPPIKPPKKPHIAVPRPGTMDPIVAPTPRSYVQFLDCKIYLSAFKNPSVGIRFPSERLLTTVVFTI